MSAAIGGPRASRSIRNEGDAMDEVTIPKIISVDDHVVEPAHLWQAWLPAKVQRSGSPGRATRSACH